MIPQCSWIWLDGQCQIRLHLAGHFIPSATVFFIPSAWGLLPTMVFIPSPGMVLRLCSTYNRVDLAPTDIYIKTRPPSVPACLKKQSQIFAKTGRITFQRLIQNYDLCNSYQETWCSLFLVYSFGVGGDSPHDVMIEWISLSTRQLYSFAVVGYCLEQINTQFI